MNQTKAIRIGGACGFWGDSSIGTSQLLQVPGMQYITFDYLAELTLAIMAGMRMKNPDHGYALDFVQLMAKTLPVAKSKGVRIIANAGGLNPTGCAKALQEALKDVMPDLRIGVVNGDDAQSTLASARKDGQTFNDQHSGIPMPPFMLTANAYLGAFPVAAALDAGADIVITGRIVDSAMTLGALIHEFKWQPTQLDELAQGSLAGHIIECGAQATGGLFTDWEQVPDWANIGYPFVDVSKDGSFTLGKPENTGGLINRAVATEQLLYEIHDPAAYRLPDVVCDFTHVDIQETGPNQVRISNAKGYAPSDLYKVCGTYPDGFRCIGLLSVVGFDAEAKARRTAEEIFKRCDTMLKQQGLAPFTRTYCEVIGAETDLGPHRRTALGHEALVRMVVVHQDKKGASLFSREIAPAGTSYAPGTSGNFGMGRPNVSPMVKLFSTFLPKGSIQPKVQVGDTRIDYAEPAHPSEPVATSGQGPTIQSTQGTPTSAFEGKQLIAIAHGRSGDKGNTSNIGLVARTEEDWPTLCQAITPERVEKFLAHMGPIKAHIYTLPSLKSLNIVIENALDGGGMASMRNDPLGKGMAQLLLAMPLHP